MSKRGRKAKPTSPSAPTPSPTPPLSSSLPPSLSPSLPPSPSPHSRLTSDALISLFLLFQLVMPLRYYLGGRGYDERFSWRMFSSLRMQQCKVRVSESLLESSAPREVNLRRELHVAWIGMLERYRAGVVDELLQRRCANGGVREVRYVRNCTDTDGSAVPELEAVLDCKSGALARREGAADEPVSRP